MGQYVKTIRKHKRRRLPFLPDFAQAFIARRIIDITGLAFVLCGAALAAALFSYNHLDPSLNTASAGQAGSVHNILGRPGAYVADVLIQTMGLGGLVFSFVFAVWGLRFLLRQDIEPLPLRLAALLAAGLSVSIALAKMPAGNWLPHPWLGGSGGTLMLDRLSLLVHPWAGENAHSVIAVAALVVGAGALLLASAVTIDEYKSFFLGMGRAVLAVVQKALFLVTGFYQWVRHYGDPAYQPAVSRAPRISREKDMKARRSPAMTDENEEDGEEEEDSEEEGETGQPASRSPLSAIKLIAPKKAKDKAKSKTKAPRQASFALSSSGEWEFPALDLLQDAPAEDADDQLDESALRKNAAMLHSTLNDFNVQGDIVSIHPGPVVTLYELEPAPGTKTSRVIGLSDDIARSMSAVSVRCAVVPGRSVIGIELPNVRRQTVWMRQLLETRDFQETKAALPLVLGKDIGGHPVIADLARMPHLLVAGTTGSGKSVAVNTMIMSLLYRLPPEKCRFIMIDPKMLELSVYDGIPHLLSPVVTEPGKAVVSLKWTVQEMENRYRAMSKLGVRNIEGYNQRLAEARKKGETLMRKVQTGFDPDTNKPVYEEQPMDMTELPYIVVIVDEFADLMLVAGKDVENAVQRLAQMARAAGIHLIMATQRPSVDVITGVIKANFPSRISFQVTSKIDSRTILGDGGAEQLLGMGDMLYMAPGGRITRVHGPFVSDEDVENVVRHVKDQGEPSYIEDITEGGFGGDSEIMGALFGDGVGGGGSAIDEMYDQAVALVARERKASTSFIQRYLQIGYNRAARIIEEMERQGVVTKANAVGKREVLISDFSEV